MVQPEWVTLILDGIMILTQAFNLCVFHYWRGKEPFVLLHIALAVMSGLVGIITAVTPLVRILPWDHTGSVMTINLAFRAFQYIETLYTLILLSISVDRWLSVEFPVKYRAKISKTKIRQAIAATVVLAVVLNLPDMIVHWEVIAAFCHKPVEQSVLTLARRIWKILAGPFILGVVAVLQARLIAIAVQTKLKRINILSRQVGVANNNGNNTAGGVEVVQIVWSSLRASLIIVLAGVVSGLPRVIPLPVSTSPILLRIINLIPAVQHMYSPVVYLLFFPQYRAVLVRICGQMFQRPSWMKLRGVVAAPIRADRSASSPTQMRPA
ncbi:hypothetical protein BV898_14224 [Hypsibius exemplaris]|uniref:G-protein coupled receptors family 1 profile domain-containing protein n=1 Tax=Hypsibius exemplaris TaxID=2072580 RepID=A0A1W0W8F8_HYPEX|nr:hypothetical protein BV898_14224 [Hypsibius exemplaris]